MKQVMIIRSDLELSAGKLAVQVAHASVTAALAAKAKKKLWFAGWQFGGQKKVVVKAKNETELRELYKKAVSLKIPAELIKDAGLTELKPGTTTCLGIGPAPDELVDKISGSLPLL